MMWLAMILMEALTPLTPATVINETALLTSEDYDPRAVGMEKSGFTVVEVFVDATGKPQTCGVAATSGSEDLDVKACAAAVLRGKYRPAADENGVPMNGVYRLRVRWKLETRFFDGGPASRPKAPVDLVLEVAKLPQGRPSVTVALTYLVDDQGAIQRCSILQSSGFPTFDTGACSALKKLQRYAPARDKVGKAWPVVRTHLIEFTSAQTSSSKRPAPQ
jgi:TonB family protein